MEQIEIFVHNFYNHTWYYPFMPDGLRQSIEDAFARDEKTVLVNRQDLECMLNGFIHRISN
jgi:hypothetical protein